MNISFDLDDTLILHPQDRQTHTNERLLFTGEYLRRGTTQLMLELARSHRLFIYTSSLRSRKRLALSFLCKAIRIRQVINAELHNKILEAYSFKVAPTKLPSHFGIDLHIDDAPGVVEEGQLHGFEVLRIDPDDLDWTDTIRNHLNPPPIQEVEPVDTSIYH